MLIPMYSIFQDSPLVADSSISLFKNFIKINTRDGLFDSAYSSCSILVVHQTPDTLLISKYVRLGD